MRTTAGLHPAAVGAGRDARAAPAVLCVALLAAAAPRGTTRPSLAGLYNRAAQPRVTWAGAESVARAVLVGPPNAGSVDALVDLVRGYDPVFTDNLLFWLLEDARDGPPAGARGSGSFRSP